MIQLTPLNVLIVMTLSLNGKENFKKGGGEKGWQKH